MSHPIGITRDVLMKAYLRQTRIMLDDHIWYPADMSTALELGKIITTFTLIRGGGLRKVVKFEQEIDPQPYTTKPIKPEPRVQPVGRIDDTWADCPFVPGALSGSFAVESEEDSPWDRNKMIRWWGAL